MATDSFAARDGGMDAPARFGFAVTPNDAADISTGTRCLYVGTPGDLKVTLVSGAVLTFKNAPAGYHPLRVLRVWATGTTATDLVGLL